MLNNHINIKTKRYLFNGFCQQISSHLLPGRSVVELKRFSAKTSAEEVVPQMANNANSHKQSKDIYDDSSIPPLLLRPGQAIWRFKSYFGQLKSKRPPKSDSMLDRNRDWVTKVHVIEPKEITFYGKSEQKRMAETIAMAKCLMWLRDNNLMDHSFNPIWSTVEERKSFVEKVTSPIPIPTIHKHVKHSFNSFFQSFNSDIKHHIIKVCQSSHKKQIPFSWDKDSEELDSGFNEEIEEGFYPSQTDVIHNIITYGVYKEPADYELREREEELKLHIEQRRAKEKRDRSFAELRQKISELSIAKFKKEIIETIQKNRVVVISGDTGCGKTTQVPQYILENEINNESGASTNIVVTQPRRISAISISERVALEFGEESVGNSIGYQVRFDKCLPSYNNGAILFCSAGILLRKLESNPKLKGVSHVIIDEVHERDVITDFLLVLLKRVAQVNPDVRIILMSASMNAHLFVEYFNGCPLIEIPGRCFEVEQLYLPDFSNKIAKNNLIQRFVPRNPKIDKDMIIGLINYIDKNKGDGAILVFLPGWADIQAVLKELTEQNQTKKNLLVVPIHSKLPHSMQKQIFARAPVGVRKVVLATNIAETSLTIDDVVYVIDPGLANEMRYNSNLNLSSFGTHWISKANAKQRSGRAGRVQPGQCYRLYTKEIENKFMDDFPIPELLRIPLENVVMQAKFHCPNEMVEQFLSEVPQSPSPEAVRSAIRSLKEIKVLDQHENLTLLGKRIVSFTTHPRLSVALVYSSMFGCLTSMLSLVSQLSANREPFQVMPDQREKVRAIKNEFSFGTLSDHVSLVHLTNEYENISFNRRELSSFCAQNFLSQYAMENILEAKKLFASHLEQSEFIEKNSWRYNSNNVNCNWNREQLLIASLIPGLIPNFIRLFGGELRNSRINYNKIRPIDVNSGKKVKFSSDSIFSIKADKNQIERMANSIIIYFGSFFSQDSRMINICDGSLVSPISLLLFCDNQFELDLESHSNLTEDQCVVLLRNNKRLNLKLDRQDLQLISEWNQVFNLFRQWFVAKTLNDSNEGQNDIINESLKEFIRLTDQLLSDCNEVVTQQL